MTEFISAQTRPEDHLLRTTELEAVVMALKAKVDALQAPESPELTEVNDALDRLFHIVAFKAKTNNSLIDPRAETVYDTLDTSVSATLWGLIDTTGTTKERIETGRPVVEAVFGPSDTRFFTSSVNLATATWGYYSIDSGVDYLSPIWTASTSIAGLAFGSASMLSALIATGPVTATNSIAYRTFGSPASVTALGSRSLAALAFGSSSMVATWVGGTKSLAEACFGSSAPPITGGSLLGRITSLEARVAALGG